MGSAPSEEGFSLIEMLVAVALISILSTISLTAYRGYAKNQEFKGAIREVASVLRNLQVRAVTEAQTYQCVFDVSTDPDSIRIHADTAVPPTTPAVSTFTMPSSNVSLVPSGNSHSQTHGFDDPDPNSTAIIPNCFFYARGTAAAGRVGIQREDNGREEDVTVDPITARVAYDD